MAPAAAPRFAGVAAALERHVGAGTLEALRRRVGPGRVWTVGGDQCTGKSTLAASLAALCGSRPPVSAGAAFRAEAARIGVPVPRLSVMARSDPAVDVRIELRLMELVADGAEPPLVLEGRMPGLLALAMEEDFGKRGATRIYLRCSVREQALRFLQREAGAAAAAAAADALPGSLDTLEEAAAAVAALGSPVVAAGDATRAADALRETAHRDADDLRRLRQLYGLSGSLTYRSADVYHHIIDTTHNQPADTLREACEALGLPGPVR